jgi:3-oxoacyl-[acyl-carrier protein] reductase
MRRRVIMVTGASRGLGREIALSFGKQGDRVVVNFQAREQEAAEVVDEIRKLGGEAFLFQADIRIADEVNGMISETIQRWNTVDVLVNNAGMTKDGLLLRMTEEDWDAVIDTNLTGPYHCIRAVSGVMSKQGDGHIVNIASIVGVQGREGQANYAASKAGLIGLTKACARELGCFNIKVNAVLPGYLLTRMGSSVSAAVLDRVLHENTLGRTSDLPEVAAFVQRLSLMNNVSGQVFNLDSRVL